MQALQDLNGMIPVGTILAFAGNWSESTDGWIICDGRSLNRSSDQELFSAIGTNYGTSEEGKFNIPMLQGMFLRGIGGDTKKDPDVAKRTSLLANGSVANQIGSFQKYGTAPARNPMMTEAVAHLNIFSASAQDGCTGTPANFNSNDTSQKINAGGDNETRPLNNYVNFIIKSKTVSSTKKLVVPPIGAVISFAAGTESASALQQNWLLCDGRVNSNLGVFNPLFQAIGFTHGQAGESDYVLPDYRGYFLRGVANGSNWDPDRDTREAPYSAGANHQKGNSGDLVGSVQKTATGISTGADLITIFKNLPDANLNKLQPFTTNHYCTLNTGLTQVNLSASGGDDESRPLNVYVDWYIRFA